MPRGTESDKCKHCGNPLSSDHLGPCPKCGGTGKNITIDPHDVIHYHSVETVKLTSIREYYEKNLKVLWIVIFITIASASVGLFIIGLTGVFVGLALGIVSFFLGPKACTKVREINRG